ncbi:MULTISPECIES: PTS sugar transporter subunit IIA [Burkholderia]|jgi:PTS system ascorbate-specific IIA component|uniref:PTS fructose transporter subunit IIA n=2 Tax=Burkholderia gladioli TaxID=28095 RepID=A0A095FHV2_BURGA|nr:MULTISPECIES: PTS sugar transporter subunit IIA [Burkholderia]AEA62156.1 PTS system, fructose-specific IIA component [Burkholderia gladioli BSR3]AJW99469.1 PTS system fructose IIA component family protein [Burkholderia gladioli]ASD80925.1 PTS fructose transporter subunit IIA [Burkholderia gladioli pv. gladioli]ATF86286.1 PTS fructose transporter subunit IIA [Burkholderia gladioli pv. gladioli]AWY53840.1 PTS fructose transporter subunit IIA [Burkholderia gladioli pv. gladioli]
MAGILIIAHAPLATALRECISHIYGGLPARIGAIDVLADNDPAQVMAYAHSEIARLREENGVLVLTDMYGATPANIAGQLAKLDGVRVLAGVNLPMLVRSVCYRTTPIDTLVEKALAGSTKGIHEVAAGTPPPRPGLGCGECAPIPPEPKPQTETH